MKQLKSVESCMTMKLDKSKACDRLEWDCLDATMMRFGFDTCWINRVMESVRSIFFSVLVNRKPSVEFFPQREIRQGDPLSPNLFILWDKVFSHLIRRAEERGSLRGIKVAHTAPSVSHLLFFDDCIIFSRASM